MAFALTVNSLHILGTGPIQVRPSCSCEEARHGCLPAFVFSVPGQVFFRTSLNHLTGCQKQCCRQLRSHVIDGMLIKLNWLMQEQIFLGCIHVQASLYGAKKITMTRSQFPQVAQHLAKCPKDSCAQLRRAVLLNIRDNVRM